MSSNSNRLRLADPANFADYGLYTTHELSQKLKSSTSCIANYVAAGVLKPHGKRGQSHVYLGRDIRAAIKKAKAKAEVTETVEERNGVDFESGDFTARTYTTPGGVVLAVLSVGVSKDWAEFGSHESARQWLLKRSGEMERK